MIELSYKPIVDAVSKMSERDCKNWVQNLPMVLNADRSTLRTSTRLTPYYLNCKSEPVLRIKLEVSTWKILPWNQVTSIADFLAIQACQLKHKHHNLEELLSHLQRISFEE